MSSDRVVAWYIRQLLDNNQFDEFEKVCMYFPLYINESIEGFIRKLSCFDPVWKQVYETALATKTAPKYTKNKDIRNRILRYTIDQMKYSFNMFISLVELFASDFKDLVPDGEVDMVISQYVFDSKTPFAIIHYLNVLIPLYAYFENNTDIFTHITVFTHGSYKLQKYWEEQNIGFPAEVETINIESAAHYEWIHTQPINITNTDKSFKKAIDKASTEAKKSALKEVWKKYYKVEEDEINQLNRSGNLRTNRRRNALRRLSMRF